LTKNHVYEWKHKQIDLASLEDISLFLLIYAKNDSLEGKKRYRCVAEHWETDCWYRTGILTSGKIAVCGWKSGISDFIVKQSSLYLPSLYRDSGKCLIHLIITGISKGGNNTSSLCITKIWFRFTVVRLPNG